MGEEVKWGSKVYGRCMYMGEGGVCKKETNRRRYIGEGGGRGRLIVEG